MLSELPIRVLGAITITMIQTFAYPTVYKFTYDKTITIEKPTDPTEERIYSYYCDYGGPLCDHSYVSELIRISYDYGVDPVLIAAISIRESSGGKYGYGYNHYGYCSRCTGFSSHTEAIQTVSATLSRYKERGIYTISDMASVWRTGRTNDQSSYPSDIIQIMNAIMGGGYK